MLRNYVRRGYPNDFFEEEFPIRNPHPESPIPIRIHRRQHRQSLEMPDFENVDFYDVKNVDFYDFTLAFMQGPAILGLRFYGSLALA